jgi:hypothetical protein
MMFMSRQRIKELSKDPREEELILKGIQMSYDIAGEHLEAYARVSNHEAADAMAILQSELKDAFFRG